MNNEIVLSSLKVSLVYCLYCFVLHFVIIQLSPLLINKFSTLTKKNQKVWFNKAVSITHAITMFVLTARYWILTNPHLILPVVNGPEEGFCLDIMMGYLWYDSIYEIVTDGQVDTLGHHILGLLSHMSSRFTNLGPLGFYSMLVYIAEGSTPALHFSWLLHQLKLNKSSFFKFVVILLLVAFFVFRILLSPFMLWHMLTYRDTWAVDIALTFWFNWSIVLSFGLLNYFWFYKLIAVASKV